MPMQEPRTNGRRWLVSNRWPGFVTKSVLLVCGLVSLASSWVFAADYTSPRRLTIFDSQPKTIVYWSNSFRGADELQILLNRMGYSHINVVYKFGYGTSINVQTGGGAGGATGNWAVDDYTTYTQPVIVVGNGGPSFTSSAAQSTPAQVATWAIQSDAAEVIHARQTALDHGADEVFQSTFHFFQSAGQPVPESVTPPAWISAANDTLGLPVMLDALVATHAEYPLTVGLDGHHTSKFGNLVRTREVIKAMLAYDNRTDIPLPDLSADRAAVIADRQVISNLTLSPPPPWRVGDTVTIGWTCDTQLVQEVGIWFFRTPSGTQRLLAQVPSSPSSYTWTIPPMVGHNLNSDVLDSNQIQNDQPLSAETTQAHLQVFNADNKNIEFTNSEEFIIGAASTGTGPAPQITSAANASPASPVGTTTTLSVAATDPLGGLLTYDWKILSKPSGAADPTFSDLATTQASFTKAGYYQFGVRVSNAGNSADDYVSVQVVKSPSSLKINAAPTSSAAFQIARFPYFYSGAVTILYDSVPAGDSATFAQFLADRTRPDLVSVVPADVAAAQAFKNWNHEIAERVSGGGWQIRDSANTVIAKITSAVTGNATTAPNIIPGSETDLMNLTALRVSSLDVATVTALCEKVIAEKSWAIVVVNAPGPDEENAINVLHDYHPDMWNGTLGSVTKYVDQSRQASVQLLSQTSTRYLIDYSDQRASPGTDAVPLYLQTLLPTDWAGFNATQNEVGVWQAFISGRARWAAQPGVIHLNKN